MYDLKQRFNVKKLKSHCQGGNKSCVYLLAQGGVEPYPSGPEHHDLQGNIILIKI